MIPALNRRGLGMRRFVQGADRGQSTLLPECLDDWVADDNPVRVIDAFVAALDLAELGFGGVEPAGTGRPSYHPAALLRLTYTDISIVCIRAAGSSVKLAATSK